MMFVLAVGDLEAAVILSGPDDPVAGSDRRTGKTAAA